MPGPYSTPLNFTDPEVGTSSRFIERNTVDLPDPEGPKRTTCSPLLTVRSIPCSTSLVPKVFRTQCNSTMVSLAMAFASCLESTFTPCSVWDDAEACLIFRATCALLLRIANTLPDADRQCQVLWHRLIRLLCTLFLMKFR